jgi:hypothetical protein
VNLEEGRTSIMLNKVMFIGYAGADLAMAPETPVNVL